MKESQWEPGLFSCQHSSKCERDTGLEWVNNDRILVFGWKIPLIISFVLLTATAIEIHCGVDGINLFYVYRLGNNLQSESLCDGGRIERFEEKVCGYCLYWITNSYIFIPIYLFWKCIVLCEILSKTWLYLKSNFTESSDNISCWFDTTVEKDLPLLEGLYHINDFLQCGIL